MGRCWIAVACVLVFATSIRSAIIQTSTIPTEVNTTAISHGDTSTVISGNKATLNANETAPQNLTKVFMISNTATAGNHSAPNAPSSVKSDSHYAVELPHSENPEEKHTALTNAIEVISNLPQRKGAASSSLPSDNNTTKSVNGTTKIVPLVAKQDVPTLSNAPSVKTGPTNGKIIDDPKFDRLTDERNSIESSLYSTKVALGFFVTFTLALLIGSVFMYRRMRRLREEDRTVFSSTSYGDLRNDNYDLAL